MRTNYKDFIASTENRHYRQVNNDDGTISLVDETVYTQEGDKVSAGVLNELSQNAIWPLQYAKSGTTHQLTGLTAVSGVVSCVFTATADFVAGDTVTVDGTAYEIQLSNGSEPENNLFASGATISIIVDKKGKKVNFKAGGGYVKDDMIAAENLEEIFGDFQTMEAIPEEPQKYKNLYKKINLVGEADLQKRSVSIVNTNTNARAFAYYDPGSTDLYVFNYKGEKILERTNVSSATEIVDSGFGLIFFDDDIMYDVFRNKKIDVNPSRYEEFVTFSTNTIAWYEDSSFEGPIWAKRSGSTWTTVSGKANWYGNKKFLICPSHIVSYSSFNHDAKDGYAIYLRSDGSNVSHGANTKWALSLQNLSAYDIRLVAFPDQTMFFITRNTGQVDFCSYNATNNTVVVVKADIGFTPSGSMIAAERLSHDSLILLGFEKGSSESLLVKIDSSGNISKKWKIPSTGEVSANAFVYGNGYHFLLGDNDDVFTFLSKVNDIVKLGVCGKVKYKVLEVKK